MLNVHKVMVPCSCAPKDRRGDPGLHYVKVVTDPEFKVVNAHCECEVRFGEGVALGTEEALSNNKKIDTCYGYVYEIHSLIRNIDETKVMMNGFPPPIEHVAGNVNTALRDIFTNSGHRMIAAHNNRVIQNTPGVCSFEYPGAREEVLNRIAAGYFKVTASVNKTTGWKTYPKFFFLRADSGSDIWWSKGRALIQDADGKYHKNGDIDTGFSLSYYALDKSRAWRGFNVNSSSAGGGLYYCPFCDESFRRMSKHESGKAHIDKVHSFLDLCVKALSPQGMKMINNPKYRHVFIKDYLP